MSAKNTISLTYDSSKHNKIMINVNHTDAARYTRNLATNLHDNIIVVVVVSKLPRMMSFVCLFIFLQRILRKVTSRRWI